jgi:uncharacterized BrkB/YihY/UPF0761 family membrane protein
MSLLPFLGFVCTLLGLIGRADEGAGIVDMMFRFMPTEVALTFQEPVVQVVGIASGGVLTLSLAVVLWIAASDVEGIRSVLNRAYRTRETRSYWRRRTNSSVLVILFSGLIIIAIGCMAIGRSSGSRPKAISISESLWIQRSFLNLCVSVRVAARCSLRRVRYSTLCQTGCRPGSVCCRAPPPFSLW